MGNGFIADDVIFKFPTLSKGNKWLRMGSWVADDNVNLMDLPMCLSIVGVLVVVGVDYLA